jgi:hypothetical protein
VVHLRVFAVIPEADREHPVAVHQGNLILEALLLPENRQNLRLEQLDELVPFPVLQLNMNIASDFQFVFPNLPDEKKVFLTTLLVRRRQGLNAEAKTYMVCFL